MNLNAYVTNQNSNHYRNIVVNGWYESVGGNPCTIILEHFYLTLIFLSNKVANYYLSMLQLPPCSNCVNSGSRETGPKLTAGI